AATHEGPFGRSKGQTPPPAPQHLYLTSSVEGAVYSFPLTNGIPSSTPNAIITGLSEPSGIAVDDAGYLYVGDVGMSLIDVFAPGASGPAKPIRQIQAYVGFMTLWDDFLIAQGGHGAVVYSTAGNGLIAPLEQIVFGSVDLS